MLITKRGLLKMTVKRDGLIEILIGALVLLVSFGFIIYSIHKTELSKELSNKSFILHASFESIDGIQIGSDVLLAGVKVGTVSKIQLDKDSFQAKATFSLFEDFELPNDTEAAISSDGLLGGKYISLNVGGSEETLVSGDEFLYTQSSPSLLNLLSKFAGQ